MSAKGTRVRLPQARRAFTKPRAPGAPGRGATRPGVVVDPEGLFSFLVLRPLSDLFLWLWRLERRAEFLYRPEFDRWCRPALFSLAQSWQNSRRPDEHLPLVQETLLPDEDELTRAIIDEIAKFTREN